jgi:hypothetical protein
VIRFVQEYGVTTRVLPQFDGEELASQTTRPTQTTANETIPAMRDDG